MIRTIASAIAAVLIAGSAQAATVTTVKTCGPTEVRVDNNSMGNLGELGITRCEAVTTVEAIAEVVLLGQGPDQTFVYSDLAGAPGPADTRDALADALNFFGYPMRQPVAASTLSLFDMIIGPPTRLLSAIVSTPGTAFIGDLNNPDEIIVVAGRLDFEFTTNFDVTNRYRLSVDLASSPTQVPLPASAPLLLFGLGGLFDLRRRSRGTIT